MAKRSNRALLDRLLKGSPRQTRRKKAASRGTKRSRPKRESNRRVDRDPRARKAKAKSKEDFRIRNRSWAIISVLILFNAYVFLGGDNEFLTRNLPATALTKKRSSGFASLPDSSCGLHPVRVFEGLDRVFRRETRLIDGKTLRLGLLEIGIQGDEITQLEAVVASKVSLGLLTGNGASLRVASDRWGTVHALELEMSEGHVLQVCRDGGLEIRNIQHPLRTDVEVLALKLPRTGDLLTAVVNAGEHPGLAKLLADTLAQDVDFMVNSRPADKIELIVEKRFLGRHFHRYGTLIGVRYRGGAGRTEYYRYKPKGQQPKYYDANGHPHSSSLLRSPIAYHPADVDGRGSRAPTIEIVAGRTGAVYRREEGAPVVAVGAGRVISMGDQADRGQAIELQLRDGRVVRYSHLMRPTPELEEGALVEQGQLLGLVGHTGQVRSDRLRLEIFRPSEKTYLDPLMLHERRGEIGSGEETGLKGKELVTFRQTIGPWRKAMRGAQLK